MQALSPPPPRAQHACRLRAASAGASEAELLSEVRGLLLDGSLVRAVASTRRKMEPPAASRAELRPLSLKGALQLSVQTFVGTQCLTANAAFHQAEPLLEPLLQPGAFDAWRVETTAATLTLQRNRRGELGAARGPPSRIPPPGSLAHDRPKPPPLLPPSAPLLAALGLRTADGAVRAGKAKKLAEVESFLSLLDAALTDALATGRLAPPTAQRPLRVADLGCGNAYLTFAAAELLARRGLPAECVGVDAKRQAAERNGALAAQLALPALRFVQGGIAGAALAFPTARAEDGAAEAGGAAADVVLALHACDTATDEALARAVGWRSALVLAAPCCQHALQAQLRAAPPATAALAPLLRHGLLRERLGDVLTEAARAQVLGLLGYRVSAIEFVSAEHTSRNLMLRAERTRARPPAAAWRELEAMCNSFGVAPPLAAMLASRLDAARARTAAEAAG